MKKIIIIVILAIFLKPILPVVDYVINYEYISKVLCENKAKPQLKCNGKCHLKKSMTSTDTQSEISQYSILDLIPINLSHYSTSNDIIYVIRKEKIYSTNKLRHNLFQIFIDHPPQNLI